MYPAEAITVYGAITDSQEVIGVSAYILSSHLDLMIADFEPNVQVELTCGSTPFQAVYGYKSHLSPHSSMDGVLQCIGEATTLNFLNSDGSTLYYEITYIPAIEQSIVPVYTHQDAGNVSLGLGILIVLGFLMFSGFIWNKVFKSKKDYDTGTI